MAATLTRMVGLAFAGADLVFEIDAGGVIGFALGAAGRLTGRGEAQLVGEPLADLLQEADAEMIEAVRTGLAPGERQGPFRVGLRRGDGGRLTRYAALSLFRLPELGERISCALSLGAPETGERPGRRPDGLVDEAAFAETAQALLAEAAEAGLPLKLDLVELSGLEAQLAALGPGPAAQMRRKVTAILRAASFGGAGATELAADRFAVLREAGASAAALGRRLEQAAGPGVRPVLAPLDLQAASPAQNVRAMRYALDRYIEGGAESAAQTFAAAVGRTMRDTSRFKAMLETGGFQLAFQPVVDLADEGLHHFEALARFEADSSPADTIRLAEELDLITDFDLAVATRVRDVLAAGPDIAPIAINVSALSLLRPPFVAALTGLTAATPALRPRLMIEITETCRLADLTQARRVIDDLRRLGHRVCLDDFGAGAASPDYLSRLDIDFVKIDGRYVQELETRPRDAVVLKHMAALCRELGIATIAEMVETPEAGRMARDYGVTLGQGWLYAKPLPEPRWEKAAAPPPAPRRVGAVEQWG